MPSAATRPSFGVIPKVPRPRLTSVQNLTPFAFMQCDKMAPGRRFHDTVVVKAAFELTPGLLHRAGAAGIALVDEWRDPARPERSSLARAGDVLLFKPSTDLIVTGTARSPGGRAARAWDVAVAVRDREGATLLSHALRATGPRRWEHRALRGWTLSEPDLATEVPIRYELAYGGAFVHPEHGWNVCDANPSGLGHCDPEMLDTSRAYPAPQWELPDHPVARMNAEVPLAGLGPISRPWSSRRRYAGTYDDAWQRRMREEAAEGWPIDYPADFDPRFFQCASPSLVTREYMRGDELIGLSGLCGGDEPFVTRLPCIRVCASLARAPGDWTDVALPLDTVHVELDAKRVYLSWRLSLDQSRGFEAAILTVEEMERHV
jgi:hypothetical protein